jgi:hypothetical protein
MQLPSLGGEELEAARAQVATLAARAMPQLGEAYADVFVVATALVALVLLPALMLPRRRPEKPVDPSAMAGH